MGGGLIAILAFGRVGRTSGCSGKTFESVGRRPENHFFGGDSKTTKPVVVKKRVNPN
jgi:hypothetical protein